MSSVNRIKTLLQPSQRFARSVHLERDFRDSTALSQYVVTDRVGQLFRRFGSAFAIGSTERAWRITGDYGTGKSCFALALARICDPKSLGLPKQLIDVSKSLPKANAIPEASARSLLTNIDKITPSAMAIIAYVLPSLCWT